MPRIALVNDVAGVAKLQAVALKEAGYEVDVVGLPQTGANWLWPAKAASIGIRLAAYAPIALMLRRRSYEWLHIHYVPHGVIGLMSGVPFVVQAHGSDLHVNVNYPAMWRLGQMIMKRAKAIMYVTPNLRNYLDGFEEKSFLLPNPIDASFFQIRRVPTHVGKVLIFARLDPVKGVQQIFEFAEEIAKVAEVSALDWGPLARDYRQRYGRYVKFVRLVPHDRVAELLSDYDCVIGQMHQGILSLSELEALAAGRPVITRLNAELYPDDTPPVVNVRSAEEIVQALQLLKSGDGATLGRLGRAGQDWVQRHHGLAAHQKRLIEIYGKAFPQIPRPFRGEAS